MSHRGTIQPDRQREGLFVYQTRMLSRYKWSVDGKEPELSAAAPVQQHSWLAYYFQAPPNCKQTPPHECNPLQQTLELRVARVVGEGMHEDVDLINHTQIPTEVTLQLEVDADFVSRSEVSSSRKQRGKLQHDWHKNEDGSWSLIFDYTARHPYSHQGETGVAHMNRGIALTLRCNSQPSYSGRKIRFKVKLRPHEQWTACLKWVAYLEGKPLPLENDCNALESSSSDWAVKQDNFLAEAADLSIPGREDLSATVQRVLERSRTDLTSLRLYDLDQGEHNWKLAAGIPTYLAVFGRDTLASAWQASMISLDMSRGALDLLQRTQAVNMNDWRDSQPDRLVHEMHTDPLSVLNYTPQGLYFGTISTPLLYPIVIAEVWHWTGNKEAIRPYVDTALRALSWADKYSLDSSSGFYKYQTRSKQGVKNQGWKDSDDCIVYPDGSQVENPLGTCEMQGFAYTSKLHFSEVLWWLDRTAEAERLYKDAQELKARFNDFFWMEDEQYVGMAIDKDNQLVRSIASDPSHCLLSGILTDSRAERVARRLMEPDMFSGWGVRTLSSKHVAYNPFAYHRGTVWPVVNGSLALGFARYGLHREMWHLARAFFESATLFESDRLPEVFAGHQRDRKHPFPALYERADWPQAWSASAPFTVMQALLGVYPFAPLNTLFLDPHLPDWLPEITLTQLLVGDATISIRFTRQKDGTTNYEILDKQGTLHVIRQPSPWSLTAGWGERVKDAIVSLTPSH